jgi:hypothetical protein
LRKLLIDIEHRRLFAFYSEYSGLYPPSNRLP